MTNRIAIAFFAFITPLILADILVFDARSLLFLAKHLMDLIEWLAFWR